MSGSGRNRDQSAICPGRIEISTRGVSYKTRIKGRLTDRHVQFLTRLMYISIMPLGQQMTSTRRSATLSTPPHAFSNSAQNLEESNFTFKKCLLRY